MVRDRLSNGILCVLVTLFALGLALGAPPATAQEPPAAEAEAPPAPAEAPPAEEGEEDPAPEFPAELTDPSGDLDHFKLRLIPLTADQLATLAGEWLAIVQAKTDEVVEEQIRINSSGSDENEEEAAREELTNLTEERRDLFDRYTEVVDAWELKGGDPAAITGFRTYRGSIIVEETRNTDWRTLLAQAFEWTTDPDGGIALAKRAGILLASFIGLVIVARLVRMIVRRWAGHIPNVSKLLAAFAALIAYWLTLAIGLMVVLGALGVNITPLFALVGGASFILAFAMQDTLSNLAAGAMIMINHPFDEGDSVDIGGVAGTVKQVSLVSTTVVTPDNQIVVVPNSSVWGNVITNSTASDTRRVDLTFSVPDSIPISKGQAALEHVVIAHPLVLTDPEPTIRANELADGAVKFIVQPWVRSGDYQTVYWDLTSQAKDAIDRAGKDTPDTKPQEPATASAAEPAPQPT